MKRRIFILMCVAAVLAGCNRDVVSSDHQDLPVSGWSMTDTVRLSLLVADTTQTYDLALMLRHTEQYN